MRRFKFRFSSASPQSFWSGRSELLHSQTTKSNSFRRKMLEVLGLRKQYGPLTAVKGIEFALHPGDVFGFIGSNGAGKTTTIRMLATLLEPNEGTAKLNGVDILKDPMQIRRMIGYMPDFFGLYD